MGKILVVIEFNWLYVFARVEEEKGLQPDYDNYLNAAWFATGCVL